MSLERYLWHCVHEASLAPHIKKSGRIHLSEIRANIISYIHQSIQKKTMKLPRIDAVRLPSVEPKKSAAAYRLRWPLCTLLLSHGKNEEGDRTFNFGISYRCELGALPKTLGFSVACRNLTYTPLHHLVFIAYGHEESKQVSNAVSCSFFEDKDEYDLESSEETYRLCYQYFNPGACFPLSVAKRHEEPPPIMTSLQNNQQI